MREHWRHMSMSMSMSTMCPRPSPRSICPEMCLYLLLYELCVKIKMCPSPFLSLSIISRAQEVRVPLFCEVCICILREEETCFVYTCSVRCLLHAPGTTQSDVRRGVSSFPEKTLQDVPWRFLMVDRGFKVRDSHSERSHITHRPSPQPAHKQCDTLRLAPGYARLAAEALGKLQKCSVEKELLRLRPAEG